MVIDDRIHGSRVCLMVPGVVSHADSAGIGPIANDPGLLPVNVTSDQLLCNT